MMGTPKQRPHGKDHPRWVERVKASCNQCGAEVIRYPKDICKSGNVYCSVECRRAYHRARIVEARCHVCSKAVQRRPSHVHDLGRVFCSHKCKNEYAKTLTGDHCYNFKGEISLTCYACGKAFQRRSNQVRKSGLVFCSLECKHNHQKTVAGELHPRYKGHWRGRRRYYGPNWREQARQARKRDGYKCQVCGVTQRRHGRLLDVHHITPFVDFGFIPGENDHYLMANSLDNLITLCVSCHSRAESGNLPFQLPLPLTRAS